MTDDQAGSEIGDFAEGGELGRRRRARAHDSGRPAPERRAATEALPTGAALELHVCMGLNSCQGHDVDGTAVLAGTGACATVSHVCHGGNNCRGQGGCGYAGSDVEQGKPGDQSCKWNGSCASPINISRVSSAGVNKGKSVWKLARQIFEQRMWEAGIPFGPSPGEGYPDDLVPSYESAYEDCPSP